MILGAGLLEILTMDELRSILAHEYGHFRNKDTAGGHLALSVRRTMMRTAELLAKQGATKMSPLWWFTQGYYKLFMRISQGASRLQEILADRVAARAYGSETFATALHVTVEQTHWFELAADRVVEATLAGKHAITNIYEQTRVLSADESEVQLASSKDFAREPSPYDSHPSALERVALANELNFASPKHRDTRLASEIFRDWQELQFVMTGYFLGDYLHRTGKNLSEAQVPLDARPDDPNETTQER